MGHKEAIFEYGNMLEKGIGAPVNREEAYAVYQKGIKNGDGNCMYRCAKMLKETRTMPTEMYKLFKEAADLDIPGAFYEVAMCLKDGLGVQKDPAKATHIFRQLAESNDPQGMLEYAMCLKDGIGVPKDMHGFVTTMKKAIQTNSPDAQLTYAKMLENGDGFPKDVQKAQEIYAELAEAGNPFAQNFLAQSFQAKGNIQEAIKYFRLAAQQHHPTAQFSLAMLQLRSPSTRAEGMLNLKMAADSGNARAQFNYALYLETERGADKREIIKYYKMASDSGLPNAMCNYASYLIKTNEDQAIKLFKQAADKGHTISMYRYAQYMQKRDVDIAMQYFDSAANQGHPKSQYELALIKLGMNDLDSGMRLLKMSADAGYHKAKEKYKPYLESVPGALRNNDTGKYNTEQIFEYCRHLPSNGLDLFNKYITDDGQLEKLRRAQLILGPVDASAQNMQDPECQANVKAALKTISDLAKGGFVEAKYVYATILEAGKLTKQNMLEARKYYQEASKAQHALAMTAYGKLLKVEDQVTACRFFKEAADQKLPAAQYQYARMLEMSGAEEEALKYYKLASDAGIAKAQFRYGRMHEICSKIKRSYEIAAKYYRMAANKKYPKAMNNYAHMLEVGLGVEKDQKTAAIFYKKAMDMGNIYASHNYARILEHGIGVEPDEKTAAVIYKKLAENADNGLAQYNYARMRHNGIGVDVDFDEAKKYYLMAIENNIAEAKQNYGVLLFTTFHKWNEAARFFEMAVSGNGGQPSAKYNYAQLLMQGMGVPEDHELAEKLLQEAAISFLPAMFSYAQILENKGDEASLQAAAKYYEKASLMEDEDNRFVKPQRSAQYQLALMYRNGRGVKQSQQLFHQYIKMAADNKHPDAEALLKDLNPPNF